jgi:hypothetical protein
MFLYIVQSTFVLIGGCCSSDQAIWTYEPDKPVWTLVHDDYYGEDYDFPYYLQILANDNIMYGVGGTLNNESNSQQIFIFNFTKRSVAGK